MTAVNEPGNCDLIFKSWPGVPWVTTFGLCAAWREWPAGVGKAGGDAGSEDLKVTRGRRPRVASIGTGIAQADANAGLQPTD